MTNAFTAKPKTDTEWLKKANASARSSQTMARIMRDPKEREKRGFVIMVFILKTDFILHLHLDQ